MEYQLKTFERDSLTHYYRIWMPREDQSPRGVVQLIHGMAEAIKRYDAFAQFLSGLGFIVAGQDLRGHGDTAGKNRLIYGHFGATEGWLSILEDIHYLNGQLRSAFPDLPFFMMGHSMGSFLLRTYLIRFPEEPLTGALIIGTGYMDGLSTRVMELIARYIGKTGGAEAPATVLKKMTFDQYNKHFKPVRTGSDWLTRDSAVVDEAERDHENGFICSADLYCCLAEGLKIIHNPREVARMDKSLPILFYSGNMDPVGQFGKGVIRVEQLFRRCGMENVNVLWCRGGRHEVLQEINKEKVFREIQEWVEALL